MSNVIVFCLLAFLAAINVGCKREGSGKNAPGTPSAGRRLADSLNQHTIEIANGTGAVVAVGSAYALVVPQKRDLQSGTLKVYASATGRFGEDGKLVFEHDGKLNDDFPCTILGHKFTFAGGSDHSVYFQPAIGEGGVKFAATPTVDLRLVDVRTLTYSGTKQLDESALKDLIGGGKR